MKSEMYQMVKQLVDNEDFESCEDFMNELRKNKEEVADWLKWRADGGKFKNEIVSEGLPEACKELLNLI